MTLTIPSIAFWERRRHCRRQEPILRQSCDDPWTQRSHCTTTSSSGGHLFRYKQQTNVKHEDDNFNSIFSWNSRGFFFKINKTRSKYVELSPPDKMPGLAVEYLTSSKIWRIKLELQTNHFSRFLFIILMKSTATRTCQVDVQRIDTHKNEAPKQGRSTTSWFLIDYCPIDLLWTATALEVPLTEGTTRTKEGPPTEAHG